MNLIDGLEDQRSLSIMEKNFRYILKNHILKLLEAKRLYWKSRYKRRNILFVDENSKLLHAMATMNYRRNYISSITIEDGTIHSSHDQKAFVIWQSYKHRLCTSIKPTMLLNLPEIIPSHNLGHLDEPLGWRKLKL